MNVTLWCDISYIGFGKCNCSNGSAPARVDKGMECVDLSCCSTGCSELAVDNVANGGGSA